MKALAILRVSTETQTIDEQKEELITFLKGQGYDEIIPLEAVGASAIKMDDKYLELCDRVKSAILEDKDIRAAGVWELSRLGRNEVILFQFKEFFIQHKIQFICKNPHMKLLNDDGSVNAGMELAFSLFATMSKQEMQEKKARFKRTKKAMAARGQYIGGHVIPFGYRVGEGGYYEENPDEAKIIRLAYQLYSTGNYSTSTLSQELEQRGYSVNDRKLCRILKCNAYIGETSGEYQTRFPSIISKELFEEVEKIRSDNRLDMKKKGVVLGAKLIKCYSCGSTCTSNSRHYVCCKAAHKLGCPNGYALRQEVAHSLLWRVASAEHIQYLSNLNENKIEEYNQELAVLGEKIDAGQKKMDDFKNKKKRIIDSFIENLIDKKERDKKLSKVDGDIRKHQDYMNSLFEKSESIMGLLSDGNPDTIEAFEAAIDTMDAENMYDVIHKHISSLIFKPISYGKRDPRCHKENAVEITITTILGRTKKYLYFPKYYQGCNLYSYNGRDWVKDYFD